MLSIIVLGTAAGGGVPQWNCGCDNYRGARNSSPELTQASIAVSADRQNWFLINASPDLRQQFADTPALHPRALRHSPIAGVILSNGEVDAIAGLLTLREGSPFTLYGHSRVLSLLAENSIFNILKPALVPRVAITPDTACMIDMAVELDADRIEVANVQYYGWALKNRASLMPTIAQIDDATRIVEEASVRLKGILDIDYVVPDYYADRPKKCMGGWGRQFFNITPAGKVLPCHAAETITDLDFESVRSNHSIAWIWQNSDAFNRYRGTGWMPEPCQSCSFKEIDFGGCRCQAFALTGSAGNTDPACSLSPRHTEIFKTAEQESATGTNRYIYRNFAGGTLEPDLENNGA